MLRPVCHKTDEHRSYLQALDDFGIAELLAKLSDYCQQQEQESLAALLISQLTETIDPELVASYLSTMALNRQDLLSRLINQKFFASSVDLSDDFPNTAKTPRFLMATNYVGLVLILIGELRSADFIALLPIFAAGLGAT